MEVVGNLFYAKCATTETTQGEWYIDSGYSNHMTGNVDLLVDVRTNVAGKVQMPTGALVNMAGMGSLVIDIAKGRKYIREVMPGYLYFRGLKQLRDKDMVQGLPQLEEQSGVCEGCQFGKQHINIFPKGQALRENVPLELIHVDL
ncbi:hypothetical protein L3X38_036732 [Prunus dulcis]|uniref:Retrovirus-related Pol polyprotein from transposon TNT 1-94-like beta-barrel domain-containing protein n=1 Tax=Prunus dulcis TaxID=3755 RepID=A0AAD4V1R8_PRUDU|nr:hypothetical protein L3X38_036732 [Prunus dulcis]